MQLGILIYDFMFTNPEWPTLCEGTEGVVTLNHHIMKATTLLYHTVD